MASCYCAPSSVDLCDHCEETFSQGWHSGKAQERERIIKILREVAYVVLLEEDAKGHLQTLEQNILIELIKEDNE